MVVITDTASKGALKIDAKAASKILQAAQENEAQQFVLVTPAGSSGGGGFFGNLFGGSSAAGGSGKKPSKVEQASAVMYVLCIDDCSVIIRVDHNQTSVVSTFPSLACLLTLFLVRDLQCQKQQMASTHKTSL